MGKTAALESRVYVSVCTCKCENISDFRSEHMRYTQTGKCKQTLDVTTASENVTKAPQTR